MRHIISILLQNEAGALTRVAGLFSTRGYNIESLNVAPTDDAEVSRLTLVTTGSDDVIAQIIKQLGKLIDVVAIVDMTQDDHIERELAIVKLRQPASDSIVDNLISSNGASILEREGNHVTLELVAGARDIDHFLAAVREQANITAVVRSGAMAVSRGAPVLGKS